MKWTTAADLKTQVEKLWNSGRLLSLMVNMESSFFPRRLTLKRPTSAEMAEQFTAVRRWAAELRKKGKDKCGYRLVYKEINHRSLGANSVPAEAWIDSPEKCFTLLSKKQEAESFAAVISETAERQPELLHWLERRPLKALKLATDWSLLLDIVAWLQNTPRPDIYLRQVDIPGVHSKFIEKHRAVLSELFDLALSAQAVLPGAKGISGFCRRYGFRDKPVRVRFRILDPQIALLPIGSDQDITVSKENFVHLDLPVKRVFITENEINFLVFPALPESMVIFGAGYGFEMLSEASWLNNCQIYYWGDIDTHGFAILDQLRHQFPHCQSLLMDSKTLMAYQKFWGKEPQQEQRELPALTSREAQLYDDLRFNRVGHNLRLEQERIGFTSLETALAEHCCSGKEADFSNGNFI